VKIARLFIIVTAALLGASCATKFEGADAQRIKTIAISKVDEPKYFAYTYFVARQDLVTPGDGGDFNAFIIRQNFHLGSELGDAVARSLRSDGYLIADGGEADAVMNLKIGGFLPDQPGPTYSAHGASFEPEYMVRAKLTDTKTNRTLFEQFYLFANNSIKPMDGTLLFIPDQKYYLASEEEIFERPEVVVAGFRSAIPLVAGNIAAAFKKP